MNSQIGYELKSLDQIFENEKHIFRIPEYQRGYSWEKEQRADLLTDIEYLIHSRYKYSHFTGTIVASEREEKCGEYRVLDIVDGQQRVTSLILLISVICRILKESGKESKHNHDEIYRKFIQTGSVGNTVFKLKLGQGLGTYFESLVEKGTVGASNASAHSKSHQNLKDAVEEYQKWIDNRSDIDDVLECVLKKLGFLFYTPKNNKEIGIMFEVINNRGKPLSELEKIKNYLIYFSEKNQKRDIKKKVEVSWPEILSNLNKIDYTSNEREDQFLRNCWIVFWDTHKSRSYYVYDNLKQYWPPDGRINDNTKFIMEFIDFLQNASVYYVRYLKRERVTDPDEKSWLERISCHPADASITPLILAISHRVKCQDDRSTLFELLEKMNFRYYATGIAGRADTGQGHLFWLAHKFFNDFNNEAEGEIINVTWLKDELRRFIDSHANDKKFIEYLTLDEDESGDYYDWGGLKYFLASYEQELQLNEKKSIDLPKIMTSRNPDTPNDFFHKEHILAKADYRYDDGENLDVNKRRLGNFILLNEGLNIKVSNKRPEEKVEDYFSHSDNTPNTLMIRELKNFFYEAKKTEEAINGWKRKTNSYWLNVYKRFFDMREEKMINFALERWRVPGLNNSISEVKIDSFGLANEIYTTTP